MNRSVCRVGRSVGALAALLAALAVTIPPCDVAAQPQPTKTAREEAASRFRKGIELFKEGDYRAALIEFDRAYALAPNYAVLYNIGQVYFQLQDYAGALNALDRYLTEGGVQILASRREEVKKDIEKLRSRVAHLEIAANIPDAEIAIDDVPIGKTPLGKPVMVSAGRHKVSASKDGHLPASKVVDIASTDTLSVTLELMEPSSTPVVPSPQVEGANKLPDDQPAGPSTPPTKSTSPPLRTANPPSSTPIVASWAITGGLTAGAVVLGVFALDTSSELQNALDNEIHTREELDDLTNKTKTFALVTDILAGGAIIAAGISLYLTVRGPSSDEKATAQGALHVGVTPNGIRLIGTF